MTNLCYTTSKNRIKEHFSQIGPVSAVRLITKKKWGRFRVEIQSQGYAFVEMEDTEAHLAIEELNEKELDGRRLLVQEAKQPKPRRERRP